MNLGDNTVPVYHIWVDVDKHCYPDFLRDKIWKVEPLHEEVSFLT